MILGIMSDSHGDADATARAVALLESRGAQMLFHCGDIGSETVLDVLYGHNVYFVWGNCDDPPATMRAYVTKTLGLPWPQVPVRLVLDGKRIAMYHGHEREFRRGLSEEGVDYVFYGHTHVYTDQCIGRVRAINLGALYRVRVKTVALLDLATEVATFLTLDGQSVQQP